MRRAFLPIALIWSLILSVPAFPDDARKCEPYYRHFAKTLVKELLPVAGVAGLILLGMGGLIYFEKKNPAPPFDYRENLCCACQWRGTPQCDGVDSKAACNEVRVKGQKECVWWKGKCFSGDEALCHHWTNESFAQRGCTETHLSKWTGDEEAIHSHFEGKQCDVFRYAFLGHGRKCEALTESVEKMLRNLPDRYQEVEIDDYGCSTFSDVPAARKQLSRLTSRVPAGKKVTIAANQCVAGYCFDNNRYYFTVEPGGLSERAGPCHPEDSRCAIHESRALCRDGETDAHEVCCCANRADGLRPNGADYDINPKTSCRWRKGVEQCKEKPAIHR